MTETSVDDVANAMFELVKSTHGKKNLKAMDLTEIVERVALAGDGAEPLRRELENFRDALRGETEAAVTGADGRAALSVALAIQERIEAHVADSRPA